jgi:dimethylamine monooxygenase subunit A
LDVSRDTPWPRHTPWDGSQPLFRIGLAPLDLADWIQPDQRLAPYLEEKERLLAERHGDVFVAQAGTLDAQLEAWDVLAGHLARAFPDIWRLEGEAVRIAPLGRSVAPDPDAPLVSASRLVQEDLVLMRKGTDGWRIAAGCVCFPSSWQLRQKFGKPLASVHSPVPNFGPGSRNAAMIERIFDNLQPRQPVWRMNWSIYPDDKLFHGDETGEVKRSGALEESFLRVEFQTLRKLERSGDILFTIRIGLDPASIIARHPERKRLAAGLRDLILRLDEAELAYKGMTSIRGQLLAQLDAISPRGCS